MKKIQIKGKLSLNKSTIANLNNQEMNAVKGGAAQTRYGRTCQGNSDSGTASCGCDTRSASPLGCSGVCC